MTRTGRPPVAGVPRTERLDLRATEAEKAELVAAADVAGQSLNDYLITAGLERARRESPAADLRGAPDSLRPHTGHELLTWSDFLRDVDSGFLTDDDGFGELANETGVSGIAVTPGMARYTKRPHWASHVVWYNK